MRLGALSGIEARCSVEMNVSNPLSTGFIGQDVDL